MAIFDSRKVDLSFLTKHLRAELKKLEEYKFVVSALYVNKTGLEEQQAGKPVSRENQRIISRIFVPRGVKMWNSTLVERFPAITKEGQEGEIEEVEPGGEAYSTPDSVGRECRILYVVPAAPGGRPEPAECAPSTFVKWLERPAPSDGSPFPHVIVKQHGPGYEAQLPPQAVRMLQQQNQDLSKTPVFASLDEIGSFDPETDKQPEIARATRTRRQNAQARRKRGTTA